MARKPRIASESNVYHITSRGNDRRPCFAGTVAKKLLLRYLVESIGMYEVDIASFCVMTNHVHMILRGDLGAISKAMRRTLSVYAKQYNHRHETTDHVFGERFDSVPVLSEGQLMNAVRYDDRNPVKAGLCATPEEWPFGSCRVLAGIAGVPLWLTPEIVLSAFGTDAARARAAYREFVSLDEGPQNEADLVAWLRADEDDGQASNGLGPTSRAAAVEAAWVRRRAGR